MNQVIDFIIGDDDQSAILASILLLLKDHVANNKDLAPIFDKIKMASTFKLLEKKEILEKKDLYDYRQQFKQSEPAQRDDNKLPIYEISSSSSLNTVIFSINFDGINTVTVPLNSDDSWRLGASFRVAALWANYTPG